MTPAGILRSCSCDLRQYLRPAFASRLATGWQRPLATTPQSHVGQLVGARILQGQQRASEVICFAHRGQNHWNLVMVFFFLHLNIEERKAELEGSYSEIFAPDGDIISNL